jgi:hypothetical protein
MMARGEMPALANWIMSAAGALPGLGAWAARFKPMPITVLCRAFLRVLDEPRDGQVIQGNELWALGRATGGS